jgi:hypothetical protein
MACTDGITAAITSDCTTSRGGGLEVEAWAFNRTDIDITYSGSTNLITDISKPAGVTAAVGFKLKGVRRLFNAGNDVVISEDRPKKWSHFFSMQQFEVLAADTANVDGFNDLVIVVERKDKTTSGNGVLVVLGAKNGLYKSADTQRENDKNGARSIELKSLSGQEEMFSQYIYLDPGGLQDSKDNLESLLVVTP